MRRKYQQSKRKKQFINSYHINQVPLPYYNPLQDPYLKGFFRNFHVQQLITQRGFVYKQCKEYPYEQRRLTNFNKFLRSNSYQIPSVNLLKNRENLFSLRKSLNSQKITSGESTPRQLANKLSDSDFLAKSTGMFTDTSSRRPSTSHESQYSSKRIRGISYKKRGISSKDNYERRQVII